MLERAAKVIGQVAGLTDRAILFHSATGKDSIALLDLLHPHFREIVCVFMYTVKGLEHIGRYIQWAQRRYPKARFIQIPHYSTFSYIRNGFFGCERNEKQRLYTLEQLTDIVRERTGIDWACYGFKQSDSLNRRLMLRTYREEAINDKTRKFYPLSTYKNADVLEYIKRNDLITPEAYGGERQSSGSDITDIHYLLYLERNFPKDLQRIYAVYPMAERLLFEYHKR